MSFKLKTAKKASKPNHSMTIDTKFNELVAQHDSQRQNQFLMDTLPILAQYGDHWKPQSSGPWTMTVCASAAPLPPVARPGAQHRITDYVRETVCQDRSLLHDQFMTIVDPTYLETVRPVPLRDEQCGLWCPDCDEPRVELEGMMVCRQCATSEFALTAADRPCYKEKQNQESLAAYTYKRQNHLNEWLAGVQGKQTGAIPAPILARIREEVQKYREADLASWTTEQMRTLLKKLNMSKYYEHAPFLLCQVTGRAPVIISREKEEAIRFRFDQLQEPFLLICPDSRNFLSYRFVLRKLCELEDLPHLAQTFALPRSKTKLDEYNRVWRALCDLLHWPFTLTIR